MYKHQEQVKEFMLKNEQEVNTTPTIPSKEVLKLRCQLLFEEVLEFIEAAGFDLIENEDGKFYIVSTLNKPNLINMTDALADIQYVNDGAALALGVDLEPVSNEVHRSNMSKIKVKDENGKVVKTVGYSPADIQGELKKQSIKSCNRHTDCDKAEEEVLKRNPGMKRENISFSFHCHDECCEDCFGC